MMYKKYQTFIIFIAGLVFAAGFSVFATTIGTNISTGGTLSVTGVTTFNSIAYTWPSADGSSGQLLSTDGSGALTWSTSSPSSGGGWTDDGTVVRLTTVSDQTTIGTTTVSGLSQLTIGATTTAASPLTLKGVTGQTANLFQIISSADADLFSVNSAGAINASSTLAITGVSNFYNDLYVNSYATTTSSNGNFATHGTLSASGTLLVTGIGTFYDNVNFNGYATTTGSNGDFTTNSKIGVASSSPYLALGVTGTSTASAGMLIGSEGSGITQFLFGTCTYNPSASITASTTLSTNCTGATGVETFDRVFVTPVSLEEGLVMTSASSTISDVIQVTVHNTGQGTVLGADISPASATWNWMAIR